MLYEFIFLFLALSLYSFIKKYILNLSYIFSNGKYKIQIRIHIFFTFFVVVSK
jgi:hypothetical protein